MTNGFSLESLLDDLADRVADRVSQKLDTTTPTARLLSIEQAAAYLGRSIDAIRHMISAGKIPTVRGDRRTQIDIRDLDAWIAANKQGGTDFSKDGS